METTPDTRVRTPPTLGALPPQSTFADAKVTPRLPLAIATWPRSAQLAGAFLCGVLITVLGMQALTFLQFGAKPSQIEEPRPVSYRVELNEARRAELLQLPGIGPNLADRIVAYRESAGGFRAVDELSRVSGIGATALERLRPFVWVKSSELPRPSNGSTKASKGSTTASKKKVLPENPIDVNHATLAELQRLPGIGPVMSQRIVDERQKKPFDSVSDLRRVKGIGPKTLGKIEVYVVVK